LKVAALYYCFGLLDIILAEDALLSDKQKVIKRLEDLSPDDGPGIQYIVLDKDKIIFSASRGLADIENSIPLSIDHTMSIFSMTKTLTAISIMQLVERQKLGLDDKVSKYVKHPYGVEITIRQLLSHTSGIPNPIPLKWVHLASEHQSFDEHQSLTNVLEANGDSNLDPGNKYEYSNIGYWLLGGVIEAVSGDSYCSFVEENITSKLGLSIREIGCEIVDKRNHAKGYLKKYSFFNLVKYLLMTKNAWGGYEGSWLRISDVYLNGPSFGGIISSAKAISRILQDLLKDNSQLLGGDMKAELYTQQKTTDGRSIDMTLGWHIGRLNGAKYYFKEGGGAGFHSEMRIYPVTGLGSVIIVNKTSINTNKNLSQLDSNFMR
jgi:D-alanyl-D-alanine carboxypeptidase